MCVVAMSSKDFSDVDSRQFCMLGSMSVKTTRDIIGHMSVSVVMAVDIPLSSFSPAWGASPGTVSVPGSISKKDLIFDGSVFFAPLIGLCFCLYSM